MKQNIISVSRKRGAIYYKMLVYDSDYKPSLDEICENENHHQNRENLFSAERLSFKNWRYLGHKITYKEGDLEPVGVYNPYPVGLQDCSVYRPLIEVNGERVYSVDMTRHYTCKLCSAPAKEQFSDWFGALLFGALNNDGTPWLTPQFEMLFTRQRPYRRIRT